MKRLTPEDVLDLLRVEYFPRTNRLSFCCPIHDDHDPSAAFYLDTGLAHCFSCAYTLDPIGFYAKATDKTKDAAIRDLERTFGPIEVPEIVTDRNLLNKSRIKAESRLKVLKFLPRKQHAELGETLDRILLAYDREQIDESRLDKLLKKWYNRLEEKTYDRSQPARISGAVAHGGFEKSPGNLPGDGAEAAGGPLDPEPAEDTDILD